ncbi:MAG: hypothetical protein M3R49_04015 [Chloroflexota bacterium]|nr:hypothetical protein [Chloroflexota bacterium]
MSTKVRLVLAGLLIAQLADAVSFAIGISRVGIGAEANGWMRFLYDAGGLPAVMALKGSAILLTLGIVLLAARRYPRLVVLGGATATSLGLLGAFTNTLAIALTHG